ncbi:hypothetical protein [Paraburkholderia fungorum]|uniref:Uncharacterized protein n=1 Tax=Paraburkholderia fungorum TaxID=134537 RepID=A0AAW3UZK8_9BURK|nr:hypothetical protein [Paraburkholderia fungorum]MBB4515840.1 hypothetical protein [Paraburkholderia fungorum]MBB6203744.1 hypothetical protein [Paraburkholderia fungorum]
MENTVLVSESTIVFNGRTVPFRRFQEVVTARPEPKLCIVENVQYRAPSIRPNSRTSPVKVITSRGETLIFKDHRTAWIQLKLPHTKIIRQRIECAFSGSAIISHGGTEYTFTFVEICGLNAPDAKRCE